MEDAGSKNNVVHRDSQSKYIKLFSCTSNIFKAVISLLV